jgi:hypothetical protein
MVFIDQSLVFCVVFCILNLVCLYVIFPLVIVLSVLLKFRTSAYPFGIFKLFLTNKIRIILNVESERNMEYLFFYFSRNMISRQTDEHTCIVLLKIPEIVSEHISFASFCQL